MPRRRVVVTGAAGFIGRHVAQQLAAAGWEVVACTRRAVATEALAGVARNYVLPLPDERFAAVVRYERPDWLVHCAGTSRVEPSFANPAADRQHNVHVTADVLAAVAQFAPHCGVALLSSAAVYGVAERLPLDESAPVRPISPYGRHKLECEALALAHHEQTAAPTLVLRVFSAYGPGLAKQVLWDIHEQLRQSGSVQLGGTGLERRDLLYVDDLATLLEQLLATQPTGAHVLNVARGESITIRELATKFLAALGSPRPITFTGEPRIGSPPHWEADTSALRRLVAWNAFTPLERGLGNYAQWLHTQQGGGDAHRILAAAG